MPWQAPDFFLQVCTSSCAPDSGGTKNRDRKYESRKQGGFMPGTFHPYPPLAHRSVHIAQFYVQLHLFTITNGYEKYFDAH
jgi:hypothetical protein